MRLDDLACPSASQPPPPRFYLTRPIGMGLHGKIFQAYDRKIGDKVFVQTQVHYAQAGQSLSERVCTLINSLYARL